MIYDNVLYDPIQGHGHGGRKVVKIPDYKVCLAEASMHVFCICVCILLFNFARFSFVASSFSAVGWVF